MKTINLKRAKIIIDHQLDREDDDFPRYISKIISAVLSDCPTYCETVQCTNKCEPTPEHFSVLKLYESFVNFGNLSEAIYDAFATEANCPKCDQAGEVDVKLAPMLFIEVLSKFL